MHDTQSVEAILSRLMPPGLSDSGQREIETMLDGLAFPDGNIVKTPSAAWWKWRALAGGLAAAGVAMAAVIPWAGNRPPVAGPQSQDRPEFVLVAETDRIESMAEDGWLEDTDGSAMRAVRMLVVEENSLFDEETGIVMQVSEPREEVLLMPVSAF